jgi:hypothetical protein
MVNGQASADACCLSFNLGGPANHAPGFYHWDTKDFGPRVAFAWAPKGHSGVLGSLFGEGGQTTIRGGFGIVYDRLGPALLATFCLWSFDHAHEHGRRPDARDLASRNRH